jgi:hypothetical protein
LGSDFEWNDNTQSAITITNTKNVKLQFNQRKIDVIVPTTTPVLLVQGSEDVVLDDVHIDGSRAGGDVYAVHIDGTSELCKNITFNNPVLVEVGSGIAPANTAWVLRAQSVNGLKVLEPYFWNTVTKLEGVYFEDCMNVKYNDGNITNVRSRFRSCLRVDMLRNNYSNTVAGVGGSSRCVMTGSFGASRERSDNIRISENNFFSVDGNSLFIQDTDNSVIDKNTLDSFGSNDGSIFLDETFNCTISNNTLVGLIGSFDGETNLKVVNNHITAVPVPDFLGAIDLAYSTRCVVEGNTIVGDADVLAGVVFYNLDFYNSEDEKTFSVPALNNIVRNNTSTSNFRGYIDNALLFGQIPIGGGNYILLGPAEHTLYQENIASGNAQNFEIKSSTSVLVNNTEVNPTFSQTSGASLLSLNKENKVAHLVKVLEKKGLKM